MPGATTVEVNRRISLRKFFSLSQECSPCQRTCWLADITTTFLHPQRPRIRVTVLTVKISSFADHDKEDEDSVDNTRHYQGGKRHFEEKRSRSSSFVSSIDDEQKPLFPGIMDYPSIMGKAAVLDFEEMVHVTERIQIEKRSHSCKGNLCKTYSH